MASVLTPQGLRVGFIADDVMKPVKEEAPKASSETTPVVKPTTRQVARKTK